MPVAAAIVPSLIIEKSLTIASIAANTSAEQTFTVPGLKVEHAVVVNPPAAYPGAGIVGVRVTAANTLGITWGNFTGTPVVPGAGLYKIIAF